MCDKVLKPTEAESVDTYRFLTDLKKRVSIVNGNIDALKAEARVAAESAVTISEYLRLNRDPNLESLYVDPVLTHNYDKEGIYNTKLNFIVIKDSLVLHDDKQSIAIDLLDYDIEELCNALEVKPDPNLEQAIDDIARSTNRLVALDKLTTYLLENDISVPEPLTVHTDMTGITITNTNTEANEVDSIFPTQMSYTVTAKIPMGHPMTVALEGNVLNSWLDILDIKDESVRQDLHFKLVDYITDILEFNNEYKANFTDNKGAN